MPVPLSLYLQYVSVFWGKEEKRDNKLSGVNFICISEAAQYSFSADWEVILSQNIISIYSTIWLIFKYALMLIEKENMKLILIQIVMNLGSVTWVKLFISDLKK